MSTTNLEMIEYTMGYGIRGIFLLMCVGASFLFVKDKALRYSYRNFLAIFFLLLLIPWTSNFFAKTIQEYLSWRWLWVTPVPVLASVAVGGALARIRQVSNSAVALGVFLLLGLGLPQQSPRRVLSEENYTSIRWPDAKLDGDSVYLRPIRSRQSIKDGNYTWTVMKGVLRLCPTPIKSASSNACRHSCRSAPLSPDTGSAEGAEWEWIARQSESW